MNSQKNSLEFLHGLRGVAAVYVMLGHARWLLWEGHKSYLLHQDQYPLIEKMLVYASSFFTFGHAAVLLFFVLSGFVIHLRYAKDLADNPTSASFDWGGYMVRRARRLYPPLLFSIALTYVFDRTGILAHSPIYFQHTPYPLINDNIQPSHTWQILFGNLAFLMATYVPAWGTNVPLWSLKFEWWFYMLYPLFWSISKRSIGVATSIITLLFILSFFPKLWPLKLLQDVFSMMISWWFGVLLADVFTRRMVLSYSSISFLVLLGFVLPFTHFNPVIQDTLWGGAFAGIIACCFALQKAGVHLKLLDKLKPLGDMSYSLYVLHFPILVFISGWIMSRSVNHELPIHLWWVAGGAIICALISYAAHFVIESPFRRRVPPRELTTSVL